MTDEIELTPSTSQTAEIFVTAPVQQPEDGEQDGQMAAEGPSDQIDSQLVDTRGTTKTPRWPHLENTLNRITIADGLMLLIVLLAAVPRFYELGRIPLSTAEAQVALDSWQFLQPIPVSVPIISPAYFTLTNLLMAVGGSSDATARLAAAILGLLTVVLPWFWRDRARPVVILTTGFLLAVSPLLIYTSRTAGGDAVSLFAFVLLATAAIQMGSGNRSWAYVSGIALGLGLAASPLFYSGLVAFSLGSWVSGGLNMDGNGHRQITWRASWREILTAAAITFALFSTSFLLYPAGLGSAIQLLPQWLAQFGIPGASGEGFLMILAPFLALLRYEPLFVILGIPALVWAIYRGREGTSPALWATTAIGIALLFVLFQTGYPENVLIALLPGYLLIGMLADSILSADDVSSRSTWTVAGGLILLGMVLLVSVGRFTRLGVWSGGELSMLGLATVAFVLAGIAVLVIMAWDNRSARQGIFIGLVLMLLFFQWGTGWHLNLYAANNPRESWIASGTNDEVSTMIDLIRNVSRLSVNSEHDLTIFNQTDSAVLHWYLRDFSHYESGRVLPLNAQYDVVITPMDTELQLPNDYFGADFGLLQEVVPPSALPPLAEIIHSWLLRESTAPLAHDRVIVWFRSDLAPAP
jgi:hypothetical protein